MARVVSRRLNRNRDIEELFDRIEAVEGVNDALKIQRHVLVDEYIAESGERLQADHELWWETRISRQGSNGADIVFELFPASGSQFTGDINHELTDQQQRVQDVVSQ